MLAACTAAPPATAPVESETSVASPILATAPAPVPEAVAWSRLPDADALHQMLPFAIDAAAGITTIVGRVEDGQGGVEDRPAFATSRDGKTWTRGLTDGGSTTGVAVAVTQFGTAMIAVGIDRCRAYVSESVGDMASASGCQAAIWRSTDGATWTRAAGDQFEAAALTSVIDFDGLAIAGGTRGDRAVVFTSSDGLSWEALADSPAFDRAVIVNLASRSGQVVAVGYKFGATAAGAVSSIPVAWSSTNGKSWSEPVVLPASRDGLASAVAAGPAGFVAVGFASLLVEGYVRGRQRLAWASSDGLGWAATPVEGSSADGYLRGVRGNGSASLAIGWVSSGTSFLEGSRDASGWYVQSLPSDLSGMLGEARSIAWSGTRYLIVGAREPSDSGTIAVVLVGSPEVVGGGPLASVSPASTDPLVPGPSVGLISRLDGTLTLSGSIAGTLTVSGECTALAGRIGVLFGEGTMADGQKATVQLDIVDGIVGMQIFLEGAGKGSAILAQAPFAAPATLPTPPAGTIQLRFTKTAGDTANGELVFRCSR